MPIRTIITKPYVHMKVKLTAQKHIQVPRELLRLPEGAELKIGHRLLAIGEFPRQLLGYLIPGVGIYDPSGELVKELKGTRGLSFYTQLPSNLTQGRLSTMAEIITYKEIRFAVDSETKDIVGVLRSL